VVKRVMTDDKLIEICKEFRKGILGNKNSDLMCFVVCSPLASYLAFYGIEASVEIIHREEGNHVFIRLKDGRVLDPTADQFDSRLPKIYLGEPIKEIHTAKGGGNDDRCLKIHVP